jgi:hypothetical protein
MDNMYILDHLAKSELKKKEGRMCALFVDFRAAFDKVDRKKMFECLRERGISEWLVQKDEEIYREKEGDDKGSVTGVTAQAPAVHDIRGRNVEESASRREKVWNLAFADDMVL